MTTFFKAGQISAEIKRRLQTILIANGCETDIGRDVMMGTRKIPGDDQPPCIQVHEGTDEVVDQQGRDYCSAVINQDYVISAFLPCDPDNPNDAALAAIRDIKRAIFQGGAAWGGAVKTVRYRGRDIGPRPDGVGLVQAAVLIEISYVENLQDP